MLDLDRIPWPACMLSCHEALRRLPAADAVVILTRDKYLVENVLMLIGNRPDFRSTVFLGPGSFRIRVRRISRRRAAGSAPPDGSSANKEKNRRESADANRSTSFF